MADLALSDQTLVQTVAGERVAVDCNLAAAAATAAAAAAEFSSFEWVSWRRGDAAAGAMAAATATTQVNANGQLVFRAIARQDEGLYRCSVSSLHAPLSPVSPSPSQRQELLFNFDNDNSSSSSSSKEDLQSIDELLDASGDYPPVDRFSEPLSRLHGPLIYLVVQGKTKYKQTL